MSEILHFCFRFNFFHEAAGTEYVKALRQKQTGLFRKQGVVWVARAQRFWVGHGSGEAGLTHSGQITKGLEWFGFEWVDKGRTIKEILIGEQHSHWGFRKLIQGNRVILGGRKIEVRSSVRSQWLWTTRSEKKITVEIRKRTGFERCWEGDTGVQWPIGCKEWRKAVYTDFEIECLGRWWYH